MKQKADFDPSGFEKKWQQLWEEKKLFSPDLKHAKNPYYCLMMFPYPSAEGLHVGNMYAFTGADVFARFKRMQGNDVLEPIGLDGFGIHSENYALKVGHHPREQAKLSEKNFYRQLRSIGNSFDFQRTLETYDPEYYKWTQWLFVKMFKNGLAYRKKAEVNWCPSCKTVLSDEQVIDGKCERCNSVVERKELEQWFFRITKYAQRLLDNIEGLDWSERVKIAQKQWIGRSEGARVEFEIDEDVNYVLLHGFTGLIDANFFPWLRDELEKRGKKVWAQNLPNTDNPTIEEQVEFVLKNAHFDEKTVILGHSLGSVVALKVLENLKKPINKLVLAAGFMQPGFLDHDRSFEEQIKDFDTEKIKKNVSDVVLLRAQNDTAVPQERSEYIKSQIGGRIVDFVAQDDHICGEKEPVVLENLINKLEVFTTRPDTLFGATFLVISPEHGLVDKISNFKFQISNEIVKDVVKYIKIAKSKSDKERTDEKNKTGVFSGLYAINPVNKEKIPVWVADYVLSGYGTGAIMAVPAHDNRDFEFAKKYNLPIKQVIAPYTVVEGVDSPKTDKDIFKFNAVTAIIKHWEDKDLFYVVEFSDTLCGFPGGHVEKDEEFEKSIIREVGEESGYTDVGKVTVLFDCAYSRGHKTRKQREELCCDRVYVIELSSGKRIDITDKETKNGSWMTSSQIVNSNSLMNHHKLYFEHYYEDKAFTGNGVIVNSGEWDGLSVPKEMGKVIDFLEKKGLGKREVNYHLRDWLISRQRYWGPPIPMVYCQKCADKGRSWFTNKDLKTSDELGIRNQKSSSNHNSLFALHDSGDWSSAGWFPVEEKELPVELPNVEDWKPMGTGLSPLANHPEFYKTKCPVCGSEAKRETDVSDTFLDSSWYFLRYTAIGNQIDPKSDMESKEKMPYDAEIVKKWLPVKMYIGGAEHSVLHLLYSRFVTSALADLKLLNFEEPFKKFFAHGLIIKDGAKMSKSKGNVVVPDEYIKKYGADTLRMYLMFLGPFSQGGDFRDSGIEGMNRFVKKVWRLISEYQISLQEALGQANDNPPDGGQISNDGLRMMHKTIKAVTEDIGKFSYNTAIAKLMEWYNYLTQNPELKTQNLTLEEAKTFLKLLAPFAPHMTEELYQELNPKSEIRNTKLDDFDSIHISSWPEFDEKYLVEDEITIAIQVNGKTRGTVLLSYSLINKKEEVEVKAKEVVRKHLEGKEIKRVVHVSGKIVNFVV